MLPLGDLASHRDLLNLVNLAIGWSLGNFLWGCHYEGHFKKGCGLTRAHGTRTYSLPTRILRDKVGIGGAEHENCMVQAEVGMPDFGQISPIIMEVLLSMSEGERCHVACLFTIILCLDILLVDYGEQWKLCKFQCEKDQHLEWMPIKGRKQSAKSPKTEHSEHSTIFFLFLSDFQRIHDRQTVGTLAAGLILQRSCCAALQATKSLTCPQDELAIQLESWRYSWNMLKFSNIS